MPDGGMTYEDWLAAPAKPAQEKPGTAEIVARGAVQNASAGFSDEVQGFLDTLGLSAAEKAAMYTLPPSIIPILATRLGHKAYKQATEKDAKPLVDQYTENRDIERGKNAAARKEGPKRYLAGEVLGGVASSVGPAMAKSVPGVVGLATAAGGATGAGLSDADLTKGEIGEAVADTAKGGVAGAAAGLGGAAMTAGLGMAKVLANKISSDKLIGAAQRYLEKVAKRGGEPKAMLAAASRQLDRAVELAGDAPVTANPFVKLGDAYEKKAAGAFSLKPDALQQQVIGKAKALADRKLTLGELAKERNEWAAMAKRFKKSQNWNDYQTAKEVRDSLRESIVEATGNPGIGEAADILDEGLRKYGVAKKASALMDVIENSLNPKSPRGQTVSPGRFATLNTGKRGKAVLENLAGDKDATEAWIAGTEAMRILASKSKPSWLVETVRSPRLGEAWDTLMRAENVEKIFTDPKAAAEFRKLAGSSNTTTAQASSVISGILARIGANKDNRRVAADALGDNE